MRKLLIVGLFIVLTGCAEIKFATDKGAAAEDEALASATYVLCRVVSIGAWIRAYGNNAEKAAAWRTLCTANPQVPVKQ